MQTVEVNAIGRFYRVDMQINVVFDVAIVVDAVAVQ